MEKTDCRKLNPAHESSPADASWFVVSSPNAWGSQMPWWKRVAFDRKANDQRLLPGSAHPYPQSIGTVLVFQIPFELRVFWMIFGSFMAQDMAKWWWSQKIILQKTLTRLDQGRLCIRSDQGLISEDKEKCVSGTCRILFRVATRVGEMMRMSLP